MKALRTTALAATLLAGLILSLPVTAAPGGARGSSRVHAPAPLAPQVAFNRQSIGGAARVSPGLRQRAYAIDDHMRVHGDKPPPGHRLSPYRNDGRNGSVLLPRQNAQGQPIAYQRIYLRPGKHERNLANGRLIRGTDRSLYVTRHYGQDGGRTVRVQ